MPATYLFYDIETTGLSACYDQAVQFAPMQQQFARALRVRINVRGGRG